MEVSDSPQIESRYRPTADGAVGAVVIILAVLFAAGTFLAIKTIELMVPSFAAITQPSQPTISFSPGGAQQGFPSYASPEPNVTELLLILFLIACCVFLFSCGVGICKGGGWAFHIAIVLFALLMLFGNGMAILAGGIVVYCLLRLLGVIGPKPA